MKRLGVTDHALVRYLERVGGFEIERLRQDISKKLQPYANAGATAVKIDGHAFLISHTDPNGASVVTVVPANRSSRQFRSLRDEDSK